jgi:hypothetical protein
VKKIRKKKRPQKEVTQPEIAKVLLTVSTPLKWGRLFSENDKNVNGSHKPG